MQKDTNSPGNSQEMLPVREFNVLNRWRKDASDCRHNVVGQTYSVGGASADRLLIIVTVHRSRRFSGVDSPGNRITVRIRVRARVKVRINVRIFHKQR